MKAKKNELGKGKDPKKAKLSAIFFENIALEQLVVKKAKNNK